MLTPEQIHDKARRCAADWTSRDPDRVARHYAEDAVSDMNDAPRLEGRAALREMAAGFIAVGAVGWLLSRAGLVVPMGMMTIAPGRPGESLETLVHGLDILLRPIVQSILS